MTREEFKAWSREARTEMRQCFDWDHFDATATDRTYEFFLKFILNEDALANKMYFTGPREWEGPLY